MRRRRHLNLQPAARAALKELDLHGVGASVEPSATIVARLTARDGEPPPAHIKFDDVLHVSGDALVLLVARMRKLLPRFPLARRTQAT